MTPTLGQPSTQADYIDEDNMPHGVAVRWDLAFGCTVSVGHDLDSPGMSVTVAMSDDDLRRGVTVRTVTADQVCAYAEQLLALVPDEARRYFLDETTAATRRPEK